MKQENDENKGNDKDSGIPDWLHRRAEKLAIGLFRNDEKFKKKDE